MCATALLGLALQQEHGALLSGHCGGSYTATPLSGSHSTAVDTTHTA